MIAWIEAQPLGQRSEAIRMALRMALDILSYEDNQVSDIEAIRAVVAGEVNKALAGKLVSGVDAPAAEVTNNVEAQFGTRLDRMMGNLSMEERDGEA